MSLTLSRSSETAGVSPRNDRSRGMSQGHDDYTGREILDRNLDQRKGIRGKRRDYDVWPFADKKLSMFIICDQCPTLMLGVIVGETRCGVYRNFLNYSLNNLKNLKLF